MSRFMTNGYQITRMAGLSLIELMIALALGIILTLGVTQVYLGSSQTYRLTDGIAHAQETVRFARSVLARDVRSAGGFGCLAGAEKVVSKLQGTREVALEQGLVGWEANGSGIGDAFNATTNLPAGSGSWAGGAGGVAFPDEIENEVVAGSDVLIVNAVRTSPVSVTGSAPGEISLGAQSDVSNGHTVLAIEDNCASGELFRKGNDDSATSLTMAGASATGNAPASQFNLNYDVDARFVEFSTLAFYVGQGASGEPALFVQRLDAEPENPQELVEGVESMQVLYGEATNIDTSARADTYVTADNVTAWEAVVSVRIAFVVRSGENANSEDLQRTFNLLGTQVTSPMDRRARLLASTTIGLRNRLE